MTLAVTSQLQVASFTFWLFQAWTTRTCSLAVLPPGGGGVLSTSLTKVVNAVPASQGPHICNQEFPTVFPRK